MLSFFKLGLYSLAFTINGLKAAFNTSQEGYTCRELLKGSYYIKVLWVFRTVPNRLGDISIGGVKEASERFARVRRRDVVYIMVAHSRRSG